jgi:hypothetical protein
LFCAKGRFSPLLEEINQLFLVQFVKSYHIVLTFNPLMIASNGRIDSSGADVIR